MNKPAVGELFPSPAEETARRHKRIVVVSSDRAYAESLRSHLAQEFDVLLARNAGEAAAKSQAVPIHVAVVDLGSPILGISALARLAQSKPPAIICALVSPEAPSARHQFEFDYVLARPDTGADLPERIRFILAKAESKADA